MVDEISKIIMALDNDDKIEEFVIKRLKDLEECSMETIVGQNYTDSFSGYISNKVHYKPALPFGERECPDLVYDDIKPYVMLIKEIQKTGMLNAKTVLTDIFFVVNRYLSSTNSIERIVSYFGDAVTDRVSIKNISEQKTAMCSEKAGLSHNMLKFLGMDSELICGGRISGNSMEYHAYNFLYPLGYGSEPIILYDPSFFINFEKENEKVSLAYFKVFTLDEFEQFKSGEACELDMSLTEKNFRRLYGEVLEGYNFKSDKAIYVYGIDNMIKLLGDKGRL